jgi:hypothetical protein
VKRCIRCGTVRPLARFEPRRATCRDCTNAATRGRKTYNTEGHRRWTYGLGPADFDALIVLQRGRCPICEEPLVKPVIDHDHRSGAVRGLLCGACNRGLGHFQDAPDLCDRAALYLQ